MEKHLQAAGRVRRDELALGRFHRRVDGVARAERLAAALAGAVAELSELVRRMFACTERVSGGRSRLPTVKVPVW